MEEVAKAINHNTEEIHQLSAEWKESRKLIESMMKQTLARLLKTSWIDGQELSQALHISMETLKYLRKSKELPFTMLHKKYLYKYADIGALLKKNYTKYKLSIKK